MISEPMKYKLFAFGVCNVRTRPIRRKYVSTFKAHSLSTYAYDCQISWRYDRGLFADFAFIVQALEMISDSFPRPKNMIGPQMAARLVLSACTIGM